MRVVVCPDKFAGTLSAVTAAEAIGAGWRRARPADELRLVPMSDGGPGFLDVLAAALGGDRRPVEVTGPLGGAVRAEYLLVGDTAYVESAQACGLHVLPTGPRDPEHAGTAGVGELVRAAVRAGARTVVVGLGGSATSDGGAGLLAALGARADPPGALTGGPAALASLRSLDVGPARDRLAGVRLLAASDVDNPLLGPRGAAAVFGPQKGLAADRIPAVEAALAQLAGLAGTQLAAAAGAGAAGGLGYALLLLGGRRVPGVATVANAVGLAELVAAADVVVSGEGSFDAQSSGGKVVAGVAAAARRAGRPCLVLAGRVGVTAGERLAMGVSEAYALVDAVGEAAALGRAGPSLAALAERVARDRPAAAAPAPAEQPTAGPAGADG